MLDAEKPRGLDAEESQTKHDRFAVSMNIQVAKTTDLPNILTLLKAAALPVAVSESLGRDEAPSAQRLTADHLRQAASPSSARLSVRRITLVPSACMTKISV